VITEWYLSLHPVAQALIRVALVLLPILMLVPGLIWWERRLLSWMQDRIGPNRVGNVTFSRRSRLVPGFLRGRRFRMFGLLQPIADGVKLFFKEDITPAACDRPIYFLAPALALFPAFTLAGTLPWGPFIVTPVADVNIGILYVLAVSSLGVYGVVLAGYASNNKYSLLGGLRASAQLISYELAMSVSLAVIVLATGSLRMTQMVAVQERPLWEVVPFLQNWFVLTPYGFIAALIFLICMVAETNRAPFDLPEAENELIAGYHTEYSSMKFAVFFMGEYAAMFVFGGILATVFFGGWNLLPLRWEWMAENWPGAPIWSFFGTINYWLAPIWFLGKCALMISFYVWLRATLPRLRYDQLMALGWKTLLPLATANLIVVALWIMATRLFAEGGAWYGVAAGWLAFIVAAVIALAVIRALGATLSGPQARGRLDRRTVRMVETPREEERPRADVR
jgi:NADH-quinone oxidoreductase subunit H